MTDDPKDHLNILAPRSMRSKFDYLHREVQDLAGMRVNRRAALGIGGLALLAAACGGSTNAGGGGGAASQPTDALKGKPIEDELVIYNWSEYDDPSTYKKFEELPDESAAGLKTQGFSDVCEIPLPPLHPVGTVRSVP